MNETPGIVKEILSGIYVDHITYSDEELIALLRAIHPNVVADAEQKLIIAYQNKLIDSMTRDAENDTEEEESVKVL